jgi:hypothetical protein
VDALEALFFSLLGCRVGCSLLFHAASRVRAGGGVDTCAEGSVEGAKTGEVGVKSWHCEVGDMGAEDMGLGEESTYECLRCGVPFWTSSWCTAVLKRRQKLGSWTAIGVFRAGMPFSWLRNDRGWR